MVQNRARGNNPPPSRASPVNSVPAFNSFNSQNRGQQLDQPITPAPLPRQQAPAAFPTFTATAGGRPSAPAVPSRQAPAVPSRQAPAVPSRQAPAVPSRQAAPVAATPSRQAPSRGALPSSAARQPQPASGNTNFRPTPPSANFRPTRPAPPPAIPPVRKLPEPVPSSTGARGGGSKEFSNFPARDSPARPRGRPSGTSSQTSQRFQAVPANPEPVLPQASVPQQPSRTPNRSRVRLFYTLHQNLKKQHVFYL